MDAFTLGIDVGTSTAKGVVADAAGKVLWTAAASYQFAQPRAGWAEQDPADWWKAVCKVIRILLGEHPGLEKHIVGIGVSGQGVAAVLLDCAGQALRPAILWLDSRCAPQAEALEKRLGKQIAAVSGKRPAAYNVAPKLLWVAPGK
jgi:xylulokinase